jgi:hypothetical protein
MDMAGVGSAFMLIFLPLTFTALTSREVDGGLSSPLDCRLSRQSRVSVYGSKSSVS